MPVEIPGPVVEMPLPPRGKIEVRVDAADGRSWSRTVEVFDQETSVVELW